MVTQTFTCPKCKRRVELKMSVLDDSSPLCCEEGCNAIEMERIISSPEFVLKGGCWAKDGYSK